MGWGRRRWAPAVSEGGGLTGVKAGCSRRATAVLVAPAVFATISAMRDDVVV